MATAVDVGLRSPVGGWGGGPRVRARVVSPATPEAFADALCDAGAAGAIARGNGRSYGDAAQRDGGLVLETSRLRQIALDEQDGTVDAEAGATIGELVARLVPAGWMLPVVPGTQHATVGGAIASDVHGKNHVSAGSFVHHLDSITLLTAAGTVRRLEPERHRDLFFATVGGMGLTGIVLSARLRVERLATTTVAVDTDRVNDLDAVLAVLEDTTAGPERVAWLDLLGPRSVRGIVTASSRDALGPGLTGSPGQATVEPGMKVPEHWPGGLLRPGAVRALNDLRWRRAPRCERGRPRRLGAQLFPLDALAHWPRLYGQHGLIQYQFAVPAGREDVLTTAIGRLRAAGAPCYLAVLKRFGDRRGGPLSFPIRGWTLALDIPAAAPRLMATLDSIDEFVAGAGGRVYLTKDARLGGDMLRTMYPLLPAWQRTRRQIDPEGLWRSDLAVRTGLLEVAP
ncbi:MAG TPA: FAD-binding oxidoreductase [Solirubrobacteraceae bacterium]|jgi:decaprenylphospho-beta-D-ribofuranose 2-oxidase|nr:FAD-binding oxidoreductase [Solirubrobacteraceae bacterium]